MPNHIKNVLTIKENGQGAEAVQAVFDFLQSVDEDGETCLIDFNNLVPMPDSLNISSFSNGNHGRDLLISLGMTGENWDDQTIINHAVNFLISDRVDYLRNPDDAKEAVKLGSQYIYNEANYGYKNW